MRAVIVFKFKLRQQCLQFLCGVPRSVSEPLFQGAHKTLGNAIGLGPMAGNEYMNEFLILGQLLENLSRKMGASVRDEKL